ncbi:hypothetical protein DFJ77DRAFT_547912 [Powellomyces hirtus]|nr:hypothetical protein DFJ77DRAFT_547912 [Powellomyces hirtus]
MTGTNTELWVEQGDIGKVIFKAVPIPDLKKNEILCRIDTFGLSANNVTYAMLGRSYRYFDFFPVAGDTEKKYGKVPVWGMATVTRSNHTEIPTGERIYGYFPLAQYEVIKVSSSGFTPAFFYTERPHLPADRKVYNQLFRQKGDPFYDAKHEGEMMLFRPLYWTSFFLDDYINENGYFNAKTVVISSASSKTAFCYAFLAKQRGIHTIALTSPSNVGFVKSLGFYDDIVTYENLKQLPKVDSLYVDVSGSKDLAKQVHAHLGSNLKRALSVGMSNAGEAKGEFPEGTEIFFAPPWMKKRQEELRGTLLDIMRKSWKSSMDRVEDWVNVQRLTGTANVEKTWLAMVNGRTPPDIGYVLSLWDNPPIGSKL